MKNEKDNSRQIKDEKERVILTRRELLKDIGPKAAAVVAMASVLGAADGDNEATDEVLIEDALTGAPVDGLGMDYSPTTGTERTAVPSACWQCVTRDGVVGFVEDGRLIKIEGNPKLRRTAGKICARGQGGVGQVYDPDRLLFPMKRVGGARGETAEWQRITWDAALDELTTKMAAIRVDAPEKFMFHYGRMKASSSKLIKDYFLYGFGTKNYAGHTAICEAGKWTGQELTWGKHYDVNDVQNSKVILNFGCNPFESHTNHIPLSTRLTTAVNDNGASLYTFDVRLSNTAAKSTEWLPVKPGTDLAIVLAMSYHIIKNDLMPQAGKDFINTWSNIDATGFDDKVAKLADVLSNPKAYITAAKAADAEMPAYWDPADQPAGGYSPAWAEGISGVPAARIQAIAEEYAAGSPGSTIISYRGAVGHFNGVMAERVILMLEAMCGNIDTQGGRVHAVGAKWNYSATYPKPPSASAKLSLQNDSAYVATTHHASHQVLEEIKKADPDGRPSLYLVYCYTPAYANGDIQGNIDILKDETVMPYNVTVDTAYTEAAMYADLLLPDATYLERWDWEDMVSQDMIPEYYIRQPMVAPLGEARDFKDVCIDLSKRLSAGGDDGLENLAAVGSAENYVKAACNDTEEVNAAGVAAGYADGFEFMKAEGAWWDPAATPKYKAYEAELELTITDPVTIDDADETKYIFKDAEGICWEGTKADFNDGKNGRSSYKNYKGQEVNGKNHAGFKPDAANKSGMFEIHSVILDSKHYPAMPVWMKIPEHEALAQNELVLTSFKLAEQTHSRTQNCKYLTELVHDNPAWINSTTASALGISDGDEITLTRTKALFNDKTMDPAQAMGTTKSSITVAARVTDGIHPGAIAISHHLGHWAYGRYASGKTNPLASDGDQTTHVSGDPDTGLIWWNKFGYRGNWVIPNAGDPIAGAHRVFDTVVKVAKA